MSPWKIIWNLLKKYCEAHEGWVLTPDVCMMNYRKSDNRWVLSDKNKNEAALVATGWAYAKNENGFKKFPEEYVWKPDERYVYIYQSVQDIPVNNEDIPKPDKNNPPVSVSSPQDLPENTRKWNPRAGDGKGEQSEAMLPLSCRPTLRFLFTSFIQEKRNVRMHR